MYRCIVCSLDKTRREFSNHQRRHKLPGHRMCRDCCSLRLRDTAKKKLRPVVDEQIRLQVAQREWYELDSMPLHLWFEQMQDALRARAAPECSFSFLGVVKTSSIVAAAAVAAFADVVDDPSELDDDDDDDSYSDLSELESPSLPKRSSLLSTTALIGGDELAIDLTRHV